MKPLLDIPHVAERLGCSVVTVRRMINDGRLPASQLGRLWRIDPDDLEAFISKSKHQPAPALTVQHDVEVVWPCPDNPFT